MAGRPKNRKCSMEGCDFKHYGRGYCYKHYHAWCQHRNPPFCLSPAEYGRIAGEIQHGRALIRDELSDDIKSAYANPRRHLLGM